MYTNMYTLYMCIRTHVHTHTYSTTLHYLLMWCCLCCCRVVQQLLCPHQRSKAPQHLILNQSGSVGVLQGILVAWMEARVGEKTTLDTTVEQYSTWHTIRCTVVRSERVVLISITRYVCGVGTTKQ